MKHKKCPIEVPEGTTEVLLHACCAPCSSAIVEWMTGNGIRPTIFYFNPNIVPLEEYEIRKNESKRHAESLGLTWIDGDYDHEEWLGCVSGLESEPERGRRCEQCFAFRLPRLPLRDGRAWSKSAGLGYGHSSRWKAPCSGLRTGEREDFTNDATNYCMSLISTISSTVVASSA